MICLSDESVVLQDPVVREAICHAVDVQTLTDSVYGMLGVAATSAFAATMDYYVDCSYAYDYDPDLARKLLADAGYSDGDITLTFITMSDAIVAAAAEMIQYYLQEIGINVDLQIVDMLTAITAYMGGGTDLQRQTNADGCPENEAYFVMSPFFASNVFPASNKSDEQFNEWINTASGEMDPEIRAEAWANVQYWLADNYWVLPYTEWYSAVVFNTNVVESWPCNSFFKPNLTTLVPVM